MSLWYDIKSKLLSFFSDIRIYPGGFILFGESSYHIKGPETRSILNVLQPGDVLLRRYNHYLGSVLIPGYFSHAAIYAGDNNVIHMLGGGINKEDILTFLRCDDIMILRSNNAMAADAVFAAGEYLFRGVQYDYNFDSTTERLYCTELINDIFGYPIKGKVIVPDDFIDCGIFHIAWEKFGKNSTPKIFS